MKHYVLDTDSVLAFLEDKPGAATVEDLLWKAAQAQQQLHMSVVSWAALVAGMSKSRGEKIARDKVKQLEQLPIDLVDVDAATADSAAILCANHDLPLARCFELALAQHRRATLVTTEKNLSRLGEVKVLVAA
jgi:uncharacterized protein with PIN domain